MAVTEGQDKGKVIDRCEIEKCFNLATVSKDWITFSPVAALHSMNSKLYSCGSKTAAFSVGVW